MNILLTNYCNRHCSFCFGRSIVNQKDADKASMHMTRQNVTKILDFLDNSGSKEFRLMGGEPTQHPEFKDIVQEAFDRGFQISVFSNFIMLQDTADFLTKFPKERIFFLANVSLQKSDTAEQKELVNYALEKLYDKTNVGCTVTSPDFEYEYLLDFIRKYNLKKRIRVGIAQPIVKANNEYLHPSRYKEAGSAIVKMAQECIKHEVLLGFDCGLTHCMFTAEEIGILSKISEGFKVICSPIIDVGVDLSVWSCFPLSSVYITHLDNFKNRAEIVNYYLAKLQNFKTFGCQPACQKCIYMLRGICKGGCLAHTIRTFKGL